MNRFSFAICASLGLAGAIYFASPLIGKAHVDDASAQIGCVVVVDKEAFESVLLSPIPFDHVCFKSVAGPGR